MRRVGRLLLGLGATLAVVAGCVAAAVAVLNVDSSPSPQETQAALQAPVAPAHVHRGRDRSPSSPSPDLGGSSSAHPSRPLRAGAATSWRALARSIPARIGLSVAPLGAGAMRTFGSLRTGHAWSSIKVPILVTLIGDGEALNAEEKRLAREALTASDNEAGAALYERLEGIHGGTAGAATAVGETLRRSGDRSTVVATDPPPPGAVSTYGQTVWSLPASVELFRALGRGCLLDPRGTAYVLGLMEEVIPEQRWGLGEASFPPTWRVGMKGGWGPEGSESGPYLVRQSGVIRRGGAGVAVSIAAQADSGSFEAGVEALNRIATWLKANLRSLGPPIEMGC